MADTKSTRDMSFPESYFGKKVLTRIASGFHPPMRFFRHEVKKRSLLLLTNREEKRVKGKLSSSSWKKITDTYDALTPYDAMFLVRRVPGKVLEKYLDLNHREIFTLKKLCNVLGDMSEDEVDYRIVEYSIPTEEYWFPLHCTAFRDIRRARSLSMSAMIKLTGISLRNIWDYETGYDVPKSDKHIALIAEAFRMPKEFFKFLITEPKKLTQEEIEFQQDIRIRIADLVGMMDPENKFGPSAVNIAIPVLAVQCLSGQWTINDWRREKEAKAEQEKAEELTQRQKAFNRMKPYLNVKMIDKIPRSLAKDFIFTPKHLIKKAYQGAQFEKKYEAAYSRCRQMI